MTTTQPPIPEPRSPILEQLADAWRAIEAATVHIACHPDAADGLRAAAIRRGLLVEVHPSPYIPPGKAYAFDPGLLKLPPRRSS